MSKSQGKGVIYDKFGSHSLEIERKKAYPGGYLMSHKPGTTKVCKLCNQRKPNVGHNVKSGAFICMDCKNKGLA